LIDAIWGLIEPIIESIDWAAVLETGLVVLKAAFDGLSLVVTWVAGAIETFAGWLEQAKDAVSAWVDEFKKRLEPVLERLQEFIEERLQPALVRFKEAWDDLAEAFGGVKKEVDRAGESLDTIGILLGILEGAVMAVIWVIEALSRMFRTVADAAIWIKNAIDQVSRAVAWFTHSFSVAYDKVKHWISVLRDKVRDFRDSLDFELPWWLTPGSPTPLELGLRGIADAANKVHLDNMQVTGGMPLAGAAAGGGTVINLYYSPAVSLADQYEAERVLAPMIAEALRKGV
jgi:hypothetical protein